VAVAKKNRNIALIGIIFNIIFSGLAIGDDKEQLDGLRDQTVLVKEGETLWGIAERTRPTTNISVAEFMRSIFLMNPDAFEDQDINFLRPNHLLRIPYVMDPRPLNQDNLLDSSSPRLQELIGRLKEENAFSFDQLGRKNQQLEEQNDRLLSQAQMIEKLEAQALALEIELGNLVPKQVIGEGSWIGWIFNSKLSFFTSLFVQSVVLVSVGFFLARLGKRRKTRESNILQANSELGGLEDSLESGSASMKLDLAQSYIDMGDETGARALLNEILDEGTPDLKKRAEDLVIKIG